MNTPERNIPPHDAEAIEATAAAWLAQRDDGLTPAETAEFATWRRADPRHEAAVSRLEATWGILGKLRDFRPEARAHPDRDLLARSHRAPVIPFPVKAGLAALAASLALAAVWWWEGGVAGNTVPAAQTYATTVDGYQRLTLEDGSLLELNSASEVSVSFSPAERHVHLTRGEAYFTVAKDPARPFLVEAGAVAVRAVGTAFNVRLGEREVEVLVTEGKVQVGSEAAPPRTAVSSPEPVAESTPREARPGSWLLAANERARIATIPANPVMSRPVIERVAPAVMRETLAWQGSRLVFVDTPLADAVAQFNRRNVVQLVLADEELGRLPIGGSFRPEHVEAFVRLLASDNGITVERPDEARIVLHRAK